MSPYQKLKAEVAKLKQDLDIVVNYFQHPRSHISSRFYSLNQFQFVPRIEPAE
jgi:hypothetical protein